jgi:intein/homing endonuclease
MVGIFYDIYRNAKTSNHILSYQLPTWRVNEDVPYDALSEERKRNPDNFCIEYGAQWAKSGSYGNYFDAGLIERCIRTDISAHNRPQPGFNYYLHVDPASNGDKYVALLVAKEYYVNHLGKRRIRVRLANMWVWDPEPGIGLLFNQIDKDIIHICSIFHPLAVTYDQFNSVQSIQMLRSHGINTIQTSFNRGFKNKIYQNLKDMMGYYPQPELWLYDDPRLILEMKALKYRPTMRGISLVKDKHGEVKTDDLCVHPDTIVFTKLRPIEIKDVNIGDAILTADGTYQKIINKLEHNNFKEILSVQPYYGETLIVTNNHTIEIFKDGQRIWKRCDEITPNDFVLKSFDTTICDTSFDMAKYVDACAVKHHNINDYQIRQKNPNAKWHNRKISLNEDFGYIIGMYISEGSLGNHGITFDGNSNEKETLNKLLKNIGSVFGISGKWFYQGNGCQLNLNSQILKSFFIELFNHKIAINKYIPSSFMNANYNFQKSMIRGMFDGDGCYEEKRERILFTTTSRYLAHQIQQLLLRFNIISSFTCSKRKGKEVIICGRKSRHNRDLYNIQVTDSKSFNILSEILCLGKKKEQSLSHPCKYIWGEGFVACKIRKIQKDTCTTVVNLTVDNNHTYVSGSINSHNCDCLAGATASAAETLRASLPPPVTVNMGFR